ncbi:MAG: DUF1778 domain-containing protein [Candidatus Omnitrophota bacterium]|jgi:uncharacterized protein (DUF1778 family)|nr:MAG: DUF1778 domain-containing protein [Candidatus Omnitrophota bacterium]
MIMSIQKDDTLKIRIDAVTVDMMEKARTYLKLDRSKFIRQSIRQMSQTVIAEQEQTQFSKEDWYTFFAMIENPPPPTNRMKKAAKSYREITHGHEI